LAQVSSQAWQWQPRNGDARKALCLPCVMPLRLAVFDFDNTLTCHHVYYSLSGKGGSATGLQVPPPFASTEYGQLVQLAELDKNQMFASQGGFAVAALGGASRIAEVRSLLEDYQRAGIENIVCTKSYVGSVRRILGQVGLLSYFTKVYGNLGEAYGANDYDRKVRQQGVLSKEEERLIGTPDLGGWKSKGQLIAQCLRERGIKGVDALFIDDTQQEINNVEGTCKTFLVQPAHGLTTQHMAQLRQMASAADGRSSRASLGDAQRPEQQPYGGGAQLHPMPNNPGQRQQQASRLSKDPPPQQSFVRAPPPQQEASRYGTSQVIAFCEGRNNKFAEFSNLYRCPPFEFHFPNCARRQGFPPAVWCESGEKAIALCCAAIMGDKEFFGRIIDCADPFDCRALGQECAANSQQDNVQMWQRCLEEVTVSAVWQKFTCTRSLGDLLVSTGDAKLVYASVDDSVWGIGIGVEDGRSLQPDQWRGHNLLGTALQRSRSGLKSSNPVSARGDRYDSDGAVTTSCDYRRYRQSGPPPDDAPLSDHINHHYQENCAVQ